MRAHLLTAGLDERAADLLGLRLGHVRLEVGHRGAAHPLVVLEGARVDEGHREGADERSRLGGHVLGARRRELLAHPLGARAADLGDLLGVLLDALQRLERLAGDGAHFRVRDLLADALGERHDGRQEGRRVHGVVDELGHVVRDEARLALNGLHVVPPTVQLPRRREPPRRHRIMGNSA